MYQNLDYSEQLELKRKLVEDSLIAFPVSVAPVIPSPEPYYYRHMIALSVKKRRGELCFGFMGKDKHTFIPIEHCSIADHRINELIPKASEKLEALPEKRRFRTSQIVLRVGSSGEVVTSLQTDRGKVLECAIQNKNFSYLVSSFFQHNFSILPKLVETISVMLSGAKHLADPSPGRGQDDKQGTLFDLYSGVGLFGISLAENYEKVIGIEEGYEAVQHAKRNADQNGVQNAAFLEGKVEVLLSELLLDSAKPLHIVVDPPRVGLKREVIQTLIQLPIDKLVYVSCERSALARDLGFLAERFKIQAVQPLDLFPQTKHVETVVLLEPHYA